MKKTIFGGLQKLRAGYMDGRLSAEGEVMKRYTGDFDFNDEDYSELAQDQADSKSGLALARPGPRTVYVVSKTPRHVDAREGVEEWWVSKNPWSC
jgi:hypothetical protein